MPSDNLRGNTELNRIHQNLPLKSKHEASWLICYGFAPQQSFNFSNSSSAISLTAVDLWGSVCFLSSFTGQNCDFFSIYMMVYFSLQKIIQKIHVFTYYISKSQHGESASVLHTNKKKKINHKNSQRSSTMYEQYSILSIDRITK